MSYCEFYRERIVVSPAKKHVCYICLQPITGDHTYISGKSNGDFFTMRMHDVCKDYAYKMCADCPDFAYCETDIAECFSESKKK